MIKFKRCCEFCGDEAKHHIVMENLLNLYWCNSLECRRKYHIIISTFIPNREYKPILVDIKDEKTIKTIE